MSLRADRKKAKKQFPIGAVVTWGRAFSAHRVIGHRPDGRKVFGVGGRHKTAGVIVDAASVGFPNYFVPYDEPGLRITDMKETK